MVLKGSLNDFSLPDVFELIRQSRKTGVLRVQRTGAEGSIWFRDGEVFFATSDWRRELLGQRLVASGKITANALARTLAMREEEPEGGRRLGTILVDEGYLSPQALEAFVQEQIQDTIFDLMRWEDGAFFFEPLTEVPADEDIGLSVSAVNIVVEGSRRIEEWNRIRRRIPSVATVYRMTAGNGQEVSLKPAEWHLLAALDGTRSVAELAGETGSTDFDVARSLYGLLSAGLLEASTPEQIAEARAEQQRRRARLGVLLPDVPDATLPGDLEQRPEGAAEEPAFLSAPAESGMAAPFAFDELMGASNGLQPEVDDAGIGPAAAAATSAEPTSAPEQPATRPRQPDEPQAAVDEAGAAEPSHPVEAPLQAYERLLATALPKWGVPRLAGEPLIPDSAPEVRAPEPAARVKRTKYSATPPWEAARKAETPADAEPVAPVAVEAADAPAPEEAPPAEAVAEPLAEAAGQTDQQLLEDYENATFAGIESDVMADETTPPAVPPQPMEEAPEAEPLADTSAPSASLEAVEVAEAVAPPETPEAPEAPEAVAPPETPEAAEAVAPPETPEAPEAADTGQSAEPVSIDEDSPFAELVKSVSLEDDLDEPEQAAAGLAVESPDESPDEPAEEIAETFPVEPAEPAAPAEHEMMDLGMADVVALGDELTALTGASRPRRPSAWAPPAQGDSSTPPARRDPTIDRDTIEQVIAGLEGL